MRGKHIKIIYSDKVERIQLKNGEHRTNVGESRIRPLLVVITGSQRIPLMGWIIKGSIGKKELGNYNVCVYIYTHTHTHTHITKGITRTKNS